MIEFAIRRLWHSLVLLVAMSVVIFAIIALPPGDYLSNRIAELELAGNQNAQKELEGLRSYYGLDQPVYVQYWRWASHFVQGDFGQSFAYNRPAAVVIGDTLLLTVVVSLATLVVSWIIAIPIGVYSASHQYSPLDYIFTFISFLGLATPDFLLAMILMVVFVYVFNMPLSGLFSPGMVEQPWSLAKVADLLMHLWMPVLLIGLANTASLVRIMRANLLDILGYQYVQSARGRGLSERVVIWKHAVRMAINPLISVFGLQFPSIVSGSIIVSIVLGLPMAGPILLQAMRARDTYLAGSFLMLLGVMLIIGNFLADLILAWVDPRISYSRRR